MILSSVLAVNVAAVDDLRSAHGYGLRDINKFLNCLGA